MLTFRHFPAITKGGNHWNNTLSARSRNKRGFTSVGARPNQASGLLVTNVALLLLTRYTHTAPALRCNCLNDTGVDQSRQNQFRRLPSVAASVTRLPLINSDVIIQPTADIIDHWATTMNDNRVFHATLAHKGYINARTLPWRKSCPWRGRQSLMTKVASCVNVAK